jgi:hypothetical protein
LLFYPHQTIHLIKKQTFKDQLFLVLLKPSSFFSMATVSYISPSRI